MWQTGHVAASDEYTPAMRVFVNRSGRGLADACDGNRSLEEKHYQVLIMEICTRSLKGFHLRKQAVADACFQGKINAAGIPLIRTRDFVF